jgi:hypothetical protein
MSFIITQSDLPKFASNNRRAGTAEEKSLKLHDPSSIKTPSSTRFVFDFRGASAPAVRKFPPENISSTTCFE